jgi:hypothetical protein
VLCPEDLARRWTGLERCTSTPSHYTGGDDITGAAFKENLPRVDCAAAVDDSVGEESVFYHIGLRESSVISQTSSVAPAAKF